MSAADAPKARTQYAVVDRKSGAILKIVPEDVSSSIVAFGYVSFPRVERTALVRIAEITEETQTPPSQITTVETIRKALAMVKEYCLFSEQAAPGYEEGVRAALLWVLNGGEPPADANVARCRECGCTENDASWCIGRTGKPCHWVEPDLCSACQSEQGEGELAPPEATLPKEAL